MNNFDDILEVKATTPTQAVQNPKPQWQVKQQQNREYVYQNSDAAIEEFTRGEANIRKYLDVQSRFLDYSVRNTLVIMIKRPEATRIGSCNYWKRQNVEILKSEIKSPIIIIEPSKEYKREDGSVGQYYKAKEVYDVSQTTAKDTATPTVALDDRLLLKALISKSPVTITVTDELPGGRGAMMDTEKQTIMVRRGMSAPDIFKCVSVELANVDLEFQNPAYVREDEGYKAHLASYLLCKKYGIDTGDYNLDYVNQIYIGKEPHKITADLTEIKETAKAIDTRMTRALEQNRSAKVKTEAR